MKVSQLKTLGRNPRKISPDQLDRLKKSITEFPQMMELRPIVYDPETMQVLGGNQRLAAIKAIGMKEIPETWVKPASELTEAEKKRFVVQDNHQSGEWDFDILSVDFDAELLEDIGIELPSFDPEQIPDELISSNRDKKPTMTITFKTDDDLITAEQEIGELLTDKYPTANWAVSSGEI